MRRRSPWSAAAFGAPHHVRLSYATSTENLNTAFDRIAALLAKLKR
jgi:aspartate/methionine/tyrosine aminotransferase